MPIDPGNLKDLRKYAFAARIKGMLAAKMLRVNLPVRINERNFRVLDIGSGTGTFLSGFLKPNITAIFSRVANDSSAVVYRADLKRSSLVTDYFKKTLVNKQPRIKSVNLVAPATNIPLVSGSIDLILFCNALEHFDETERINSLVDAHRLLATDGMLLVLGPVSSPLEIKTYKRREALGKLPKGPVELLLGGSLRSLKRSKIVDEDTSSEKYYFIPGAAARIKRVIEDHDYAGRLLKIRDKTPNLVDLRRDPDHKVWFSPDSLKSLLSSAGFKLCDEGEDYFIFGTTHGYLRAICGYLIQSLMPFSLRKFFAHAQVYTCRKQ